MFRYLNILLLILVANKVEGGANSTELDTVANHTNFINKCCPMNQIIGLRKRCVNSKESYNITSIVLYDDNMRQMEESFDEVLTLAPGKFDDLGFRLESFDAQLISSNIYVMQNGDLKLEFPNNYERFLTIEKQNYCVDFKLKRSMEHGWDETSMRYYFTVPIPEPIRYSLLTPFGLLLSSFFLLLVLIIYCMLPELHNLCGKILIAFVVNLFLAFVILAAMHLMWGTVTSCIAMTAVVYYCFLSSFFWLTVMSFDIWWTFRSFVNLRPIRRESEKTKFVLYSLYACGVPMIMTVGLSVINSMDMSHLPWFITPKVPQDGCYLGGGHKFIYLHIPMLILIFWNFVLYFFAAIKVHRLSRRTALLDSTSACSLQVQHTHKMRFIVYLKLSIVMGLYWISDFLDAMYPTTRRWYISDGYGSIVGFLIFLILVCKSHIFSMLHSRYGRKKSSIQKAGPLSKIQTDSEPIKPKQEPATLKNKYYRLLRL